MMPFKKITVFSSVQKNQEIYRGLQFLESPNDCKHPVTQAGRSQSPQLQLLLAKFTLRVSTAALGYFQNLKKNHFSVLKKENKLEETWLLWALTGPGRLGAAGVGWTRCQRGRRTLVQRCPLGWDQVSAAGGVGWRPVKVRARGTSVSFSFLKAGRRANWSVTGGFLCAIIGFSCKQVGMQHRLLAGLMTFWTTTEKIAKWL